MNLSLHQHLDWTGLLQAWARSEHSPTELARMLGLADSAPATELTDGGGLFRRAEVVDARPEPGGAALELDDSVDPHWAAALIRALEQSG